MTAALVLVPLVGALLAWRAPARPAGTIAFLSVVLTLILSLFLPGAGRIDLPWLGAAGIGLRLDPSGLAAVLVGAASLAMVGAVLAAALRVEERRGAFLGLLLLMQAALNGLFLADDLVLMYVFWEAALVPSLLMLGIWGREGRRGAVTKYLIYAIAGSFLMLVSILAIRPLSGAASYAFADLLPATRDLGLVEQSWLFAGFAAAFLVKLPLFPLHSWLIDFHEQNHPSGAADVAGTLYKVGGFGFFAWAIPLLPDAALAFRPWLLTFAAITALWAALAATQQRDLKRMLAYASLSHMGLVGVGVFSLQPAGMTGAMTLLAAQMVSTGGLFLLSGMLHDRRRSFALDRFGGLARSAPALAALTLFVVFAAIGVPGLSNFPGEFASLLGGFEASPWLGGLATLSVIAAGAYGVNLYARLFHGPPRERAVDVSGAEVAMLAPMLAGILWFGLAPAPQMARIDADTTVAIEGPAVTEAAAGAPAVAAEGPDAVEAAAASAVEASAPPEAVAADPAPALGGER